GHSVPDAANGTPTKDGRVVFGQFHKRFFMAFQTRISGPIRLLIAVSKSENPQDGWWTYEDNMQNDGVTGQDYMWMGINASHLLISNQVQYPGQPNPVGVTRHLMYRNSALVDGKPLDRTEWSHPDGRNAVPCVHNSYTTDSFWIRRDDDSHIRVFAVRQGKVEPKQVAIKPSISPGNGMQKDNVLLSYSNIDRTPQNAEYRDGKIVFVSNDRITWPGQATPNNCVRLVRLDVAKFFQNASKIVTVQIDRLFGLNNAADPAGSVFDYGWPAVATNAKGDIVVGSIRSNPTIYPEQRANVWFAGETDISSSVSLKTSQVPLMQFHMAGACADPVSNAVYLAQQWADTPTMWRIHIAKMLS
ncbi:MAG TPA: hypothetical protein VJS13_08255, partial [Pyrinomonadaceae bacterium]|nr:hypothetical protein [Pyrinomonadaceae bacterium]